MNTFFSSSIEPDTLLPLTSDVVFMEGSWSGRKQTYFNGFSKMIFLI